MVNMVHPLENIFLTQNDVGPTFEITTMNTIHFLSGLELE
jgi:hypothetical protein